MSYLLLFIFSKETVRKFNRLKILAHEEGIQKFYEQKLLTSIVFFFFTLLFYYNGFFLLFCSLIRVIHYTGQQRICPRYI